MLKINTKTKIIDIINQDYTVLSIFIRLNILPGYGDKTLDQVTGENKLEPEFLSKIIEAYIDPDFTEYTYFLNKDIKLITSFLKGTHNFYKDDKIPELKSLFTRLLDQAITKNNIKIIEHYFDNYLEEFYAHMEYEEKQVFPYAEELYNIIKTKSASKSFIKGFRKFSIQEYTEQHEDGTQEKLNDLKNILLKFLPELTDYKIYYQIISKLFRLGKDMDFHMNMENRILVPALVQMSSTIEELLFENKINLVQP